MSNRFKMLAAAGAIAIAAAGIAHAAQNPFIKNPAQVQSGTYEIDPAHAKITWSVSHLGFSTYVGQFSGVTGSLSLNSAKPAESKLQATVAIDSVGTLNPHLDAHLKTADFFDAATFPTATFKATGIRVKDGNKADITGDLTLRGVTKTITIEAEFNQAGVNPVDQKYSVGFDGEAKIKRSDYGINYALPVLGDEVELHLEAEFKLVGDKAAK